MNTRLLGTIGMIASVAWVVTGLRIAILRMQDLDKITTTGNLIWAVGGFCGILGLVALRVTGTNPILRLLSYLPAAGFFSLTVGAALTLTGLVPNPSDNWLSGISFLLILPGMIIVGILTIAAKTWTGWRKFTPLLPILGLLIAAALETITGVWGISYIIPGAACVLLGYAVQSSKPVSPSRTVAA